MKDREFILGEIKRTAALNGDKPIGQTKFQTETGIAQHEWRGVYWARWGDALLEAGFDPLQWTEALEEEFIFEALVTLVRKYNHYPVKAEIQIEKKNDPGIPGPVPIRRSLGSKKVAIKKLHDYCASKPEYSDVTAILMNENIEEKDGHVSVSFDVKSKKRGHVYLVKMRTKDFYKIGSTHNIFQRLDQLNKQTPGGIVRIHEISVFDDAVGIENYWHKRFQDKLENNEWFRLSGDDVRVFKKRKTM